MPGFEHSYHGFVKSFGVIKYVMVEHELTQLTLELSIPALINSLKPFKLLQEPEAEGKSATAQDLLPWCFYFGVFLFDISNLDDFRKDTSFVVVMRAAADPAEAFYLFDSCCCWSEDGSLEPCSKKTVEKLHFVYTPQSISTFTFDWQDNATLLEKASKAAEEASRYAKTAAEFAHQAWTGPGFFLRDLETDLERVNIGWVYERFSSCFFWWTVTP